MPPKKTQDKTSVVQLTSNQGDHQVGETFTAAEADAKGIADHCQPFAGQTDRALAPEDTTTR